MINPNQPYNKLPNIPPFIDLKDQDILLATVQATDAIAQLKTMLTMSKRTIRNTLDLLSPLFVPEAVSSSGIEDIVTTNDSVYYAKIMEERKLNPAEKEALNYTEALLTSGLKLISKGILTTNDYIKMQSIIEPSNAGLRKLPGTQILNRATGAAYYIPPIGEDVIRNLLANFEEYFNEESPIYETFSRMAILHYQFEAIHPFRDGNGRTGRMLMPLYLMKQGRLPLPILFISHYILEHRDQYYQKLRNVTNNGGWKKWILYITTATAEQAHYTCNILEKIRVAVESTKETLVGDFLHLHKPELLDYIFSNVYFTHEGFQKAIGVSYLTARRYLQELEKIHIVKKHKQTGKNKYIYINPRYVSILKQA